MEGLLGDLAGEEQSRRRRSGPGMLVPLGTAGL